ncbi:TIGR01621 family pseudouridine synthase [Grimontia hollisae]|uniref:Ribosomal large subunit pseudouridine synthase C n=2 Tax=Grimontia hollisae TaxID=673 RepID=A0A377HLJ6_GRIHO|nr:TIGR01621 family pseudouridine synthase [Grimontia hollisae]AMG32089.1 TIGR01621 family pseudouridine synthase [Grimontia hollisae]EEY71217.1 putative pseudouridine synthase Rlu family protein [Grimontia hollisae CIP 101886]MDF2186538.1 TIGR01621 family pseudouridine synthase [Grimontia hollisae]STO43828.1 Ribosomal large subunit pseudouridine synthase C [Grimontia hollisae]STO57111.1 Ribosomal large subunit pseudouridine synthase C [Grimontia hollisae]
MFTLIFQNDDFLVIDKHPGISVHKDDNDQPLLSEVAKKTGNEKLYLIHRLDKMTSGLLLLGKHPQAASDLSLMFAEKTVQKFYLALSAKKPGKKQGTIVGDMAKSRRSMWKLLPTKSNPAITQFFSTAGGEGKRLFLCKPYTGKTHQIRVALKSVGSPILGDSTYRGADADRGYLHAFALQFTYQGDVFSFQQLPTIGEKWPVLPKEWHSPEQLHWPVLPKNK